VLRDYRSNSSTGLAVFRRGDILKVNFLAVNGP